MRLTFKRINLKIDSLAGLEGGGVSIAADADLDGDVQPVTLVVDPAGWQRIASNVAWFAKTRPVRPTATAEATNIHLGKDIADLEEVLDMLAAIRRAAIEARDRLMPWWPRLAALDAYDARYVAGDTDCASVDPESKP